MNVRSVAISVLLLGGLPAVSDAEFRQMRQAISGIEGPTGARAISVALKKIEGVESAKVLNEGLVEIALEIGNRVTVEQIRRAIRSRGLTPRECDVRVAGKVVEEAGKPALLVTNLDIVYRLVDHPEAKGRVSELQRSGMGRLVLAEGRIPAPPEGAGEETLPTLELNAFALQRE